MAKKKKKQADKKAPYGYTASGRVRKKPLKKNGKPRKTKPEKILSLPDEAFEMASIGCSDKDIKTLYKISNDAWDKGIKNNPEIAERLAHARTHGKKSVVKAIFDLAVGHYQTTNDGAKVYEKAPDLNAIKFFLCNRHRDDWQNERKMEVKHSGEIKDGAADKPPRFEDMNDEDLETMVATLMAEKAKRHAKQTGKQVAKETQSAN